MISTSKAQLHHKIWGKINCHSYIHLYILAAFKKDFYKFYLLFWDFLEALIVLEKVGQMYAFCGGRPMF
jgi:hypothetical protein